jgi:hypothetical protein
MGTTIPFVSERVTELVVEEESTLENIVKRWELR